MRYSIQEIPGNQNLTQEKTDMKYIVDRLKEPSTWRGIIMLLTALGLSIEPELATAIVTAGVSAVGLVGVVTRDK